MLTRPAQFKLQLLGPFRLLAPDGRRVAISSRKGAALIALLAVSKGGERARGWLQSVLWGSREPKEANASLRRELFSLRKQLNIPPFTPLICERDRIRLDLGLVGVDVLELDEEARGRDFGRGGEFLEGFDIPGEETFEDWLREQRDLVESRAAVARAMPLEAPAAPPAAAAPAMAEWPSSSQASGAGPSLAVLRVTNLGGNRDDAYLAEGIKQELINRLSRLRWLSVIAGDPGEPRAAVISPQYASALGAKYLLDGAIRTSGDTVVIDVTLYESARLLVLWSKRVEIARAVVASALDECLQELVAHLGAKIDRDEQLDALSKVGSSARVTDLIWRGRWHLNQLQHADSDIAQQLFAQALALEPHSPEALINATHALAWSIWSGRQSSDRVHEMRRLAQLSMQADPGDGRAYWLAGTAETWLRHMKPALDLLSQAVILTPSLAIAHAQIGCTLNLCGKAEHADHHLQLARRLSPFDVHLFFVLGELAMMSGLLSKHEEAIAYADLAIARRQQYWYAHMIKIDALLRLGERAQAIAAFEELLALKPRFSSSYIDWIPFEDRSLNQAFVDSINSVSAALAATASVHSR